jgi:hypothetical protein
VYRELPPIGIRRRVNRKICPFGGDYLVDVDEGIREEVRIFNEELNINTNASCEGHLPVKKVNAYVLGKISDDQRTLLHKYMKSIGKHCNKIDNIRKYDFIEKDYKLTFSLFDRCLKGQGNRFRINIRPDRPVKFQNRWDNIRKTGFKKAINILKQIF